MRNLVARVASKYMKTSSDHLELHVFDFDNTLFRSPEPPEWWSTKKMGYWFNDAVSLSEPFVPQKPSSDYWFNGVVSEAKRSISDMNTLAIMCTGRPNREGAMRYRVAELLKDKGLDFDEVHLNTGGQTARYKAKLVFDLLNKYPNIKSVSVWEDTQENLDAIEKVCDHFGLEFNDHLIKPNPYPVDDVSKEEYEAMMKMAKVSSRPNMVDAQEVWKKYGPRRTPSVCVEMLARGLLNTGVGFIKDEHSRIESLTKKQVRDSILDYLYEELANVSEYYQDRESEIKPLPWDKAKKGSITVNEVVSPRTGVRGWKITLR